MTELTTLTHIIFTSSILIIPCKFISDWQDFNEYRRHGASGQLEDLQLAAKRWIQIHCGCALVAVIICTLIARYPLPEDSERLSGITAVYALICMISAAAESILAQKIATAMRES